MQDFLTKRKIHPYGTYYAKAFNTIGMTGSLIHRITAGFIIHAAFPRTYDATFYVNPGFTGTTVGGVTIVAGLITQLGIIPIP